MKLVAVALFLFFRATAQRAETCRTPLECVHVDVCRLAQLLLRIYIFIVEGVMFFRALATGEEKTFVFRRGGRCILIHLLFLLA